MTDLFASPDAFTDDPGVYEICFPSGARYVGMTVRSVRTRLKWHVCAAKRGNHKQPVHAAMAKYDGCVTFARLAVLDGETPADAETRLIRDRLAQGVRLYNLTAGGDGIAGFNHSQSTKDKQSESAKRSWTAQRRADAAKMAHSPDVNHRLREGQKKSWTEERRNAFGVGMRDRNPAKKLSKDQVLAAADAIRAGASCASIARGLDVTPEAISAIKTGKNWAYLTGLG